jgi:negative regulator of replication initiation
MPEKIDIHNRNVTALPTTTASNAAKIAKKQLAKAKTTGAKKVWENAAKNLAKLMNSHEYTEEQKAQIAEQLIQESLRQAESAK